MGGFFGVSSRHEAVTDVFFGTDYHSHLGTRRGGLASWSLEEGFKREIHNIENSPFRTKFERVFEEMSGTSAIGCISDSEPQPLLVRSNLGTYAITTVGRINNAEELADHFLSFSGGHFSALSGAKPTMTEICSAMIDQKSDFCEGIKFAQEVIEGTASMLILCSDGSIIAARDKLGRIPVSIGRNGDGHSVSFEAFAYTKLGYEFVRELGPGEIVQIYPDRVEVLSPPRKKKKVCAFLWTYYGYPSSEYEGLNVELARTRNGEIMARNDKERGNFPEVDYVSGVPDSGTPHAIGYANESHKPFARPFIKYTPTWPRSFMPPNQKTRNMIAKMKLIPVKALTDKKKLLIVDDSIVRGTQLKETVEFLYENGAEEVHMRSACPPIMYGCKYLNFSRNTSDYDLIARSFIRELEGDEGEKHIAEYSNGSTERGKALRRAICERFNFASLDYQTVEGVIESIGMGEDEVCTYCWTGKE